MKSFNLLGYQARVDYSLATEKVSHLEVWRDGRILSLFDHGWQFSEAPKWIVDLIVEAVSFL